MLLLGLLVVATAFVTFRVASIEVLNETIDPFAGWVFAIGFIGIYLLSDREIGNLENHEGVALLVPIVAAIGMNFVPELQSLLNDYNPALGIALVAITLVGFYVLATNMELSYVALEVLLGLILAVTAGIQYGVLSIEVLNAHIAEISIWVFVLTLAGAYMVSERSMGTFTRMEIGAMVIGIGTYAAYVYVPEVSSIVQANNPYAGVGLTLILAFAYYVLMNNGAIRA